MHPQVRLLSVAFDTPILVEILRANRNEFMTLWLVDQIYAVVKDEKLANEAMKEAKKKINPIKTRNNLWQ